LLSQFSGQTVPQPWSGDPKISITEPSKYHAFVERINNVSNWGVNIAK